MFLNIRPSSFTRPEMFEPDLLVMDNKWAPLGKLGMVRPLMFDVTNGGWVSILKVQGEGSIPRHRHAARVTAWTLEGAWGYREHDWVARAGSFVFEPAGHIHTLYVHPSEKKMAALFHVSGPLLYVDDKGDVIDYDDVFLLLERYRKHCQEAGVADGYVESLIR